MKNPALFLCLILGMLVAACGQNTPQATSAKPVEPTLTHTTTPSPTIPSATATSIPGATPSPFPTLPTLPTLAPATPERNPSAYHLVEETADQANENLARLEQAILSLENAPAPDNAPGSRPNYVSYYRAAWYAALDALTHYPNDPRVEAWRWKMAYYMALSGDGELATQIYLQQINKAVNQRSMKPEELTAYFRSGEASPSYMTQTFTLKLTPIKASQNNTDFLVMIGSLEESIDTPGGTCLLVTQSGQKYTTYEIYNGFPSMGFFEMLRNPVSCYLRDVTGDGIDEIIVDRYEGGHVGTTYIRIYDISSLPPKALPFYPNKKTELDFWGGYLEDPGENANKIVMEEALGYCNESALRTFEWNGSWFGLTSGKADFHNGVGPAENCTGRLINFSEELSIQDAVKLFGQSFEAYKPNVEGLNKDFIEEFRVLEGLYSAYLGDVETARAIFNEIANSPLLENSAWVTPAKNFLRIYHSKADLYKASLTIKTCSPTYAQFRYPPTACIDIKRYDQKLALQYTVATAFVADPIEKIPNNLKELGIRVRQYGMFDFDKNGEEELWVTLSHPLDEEIELWVAAHSPKGIKFSFVANISNSRPEFVVSDDSNKNVITTVNSATRFWLVRHPLNGELFVVTPGAVEGIEPAQQRANDFLSARQEVFESEDYQTLFLRFSQLAQKYSSCPFAVVNSDGATAEYYDCAAFYYTLALSDELAKKPEEATALYYKIWAEYPSSAFSILARLKIQK